MKTLVAAVALAAVISGPAFAQSQHHRHHSPREAYGAITPFGSPTTGGNTQNRMNATREAAIRECVVAENKVGKQYTMGNQATQVYRSCMMQHGQPE